MKRLMFMALACLATLSTFALDIKGSLGGNASYVITEKSDNTCKITISGTGALPDFTRTKNLSPFMDTNTVAGRLAPMASEIVIEDGITYLGNFFMPISYTGEVSLSLPCTLTDASTSAFLINTTSFPSQLTITVAPSSWAYSNLNSIRRFISFPTELSHKLLSTRPHADEQEVPAVEATCTTTGHKVYYACSGCQQISAVPGFKSARHTFSSLEEAGSVLILPALGHETTHTASLLPTCEALGHVEYWHCSLCELDYSDEACTEVLASTVLSALGHDPAHHERVEATCTDMGMIEYWHCARCETNYLDETCTEPTSNLTIPATGHSLTYFKRKDQSCTETGIERHYHCDVCGIDFEDFQCTIIIENVVLPPNGHRLLYMPAINATCTSAGRVESYYCQNCHKYGSDMAFSEIIDNPNIPVLGHDVESLAATEPTCTEVGHYRRYHCKRCDNYYLDEACTTEYNLYKPAVGHRVVEVAYVSPTCTESGTSHHWHCERCGDNFNYSQALPSQLLENTLLPALGHSLTYYAAKEPSHGVDGRLENWYCSRCNIHFKNNDCSQIYEESTVVPGEPHRYSEAGFCTYCDDPQRPSIEGGKYHIYNAGHLWYIYQSVHAGTWGLNACLEADIEFVYTTTTEDGVKHNHRWLGLCGYDNFNYMKPYTGTFDGQGHTISGLIFNAYYAENPGYGFCGRLKGTVKNLHLRNCNFSVDSREVVGGIAGINDGGRIECCSFEGKLSGSKAGGIAATNSGTIINCYNLGFIDAYGWGGGIAVTNQGTISNCFNMGNFKKDLILEPNMNSSTHGAIIYENVKNGTLYNCYALRDETHVLQTMGSGDDASQIMTPIDFKGGLLCTVLNEGQDHVWRQMLGHDEHPVFRGPKVLFNDVEELYYNLWTLPELTAVIQMAQQGGYSVEEIRSIVDTLLKQK